MPATALRETIHEFLTASQATTTTVAVHSSHGDALIKTIDKFESQMGPVEATLTQVKLKSSEGTLRYPVMLNEQFDTFRAMIENADAAPTQSMLDVYASLNSRLSAALTQWNALLKNEVPALDAADVAVLEVGRLREVGAHGAAVAQHQPAAAHIAAPGSGIDAVVDAGRDVGCAVKLVLEVKRQFGEIDGVAFDHHLMHRSIGRRYFDHRLRVVHAPRVFVHEVALVGAEGGSEPAPAARHRGHHFVLLGANPLKIFGLR